LRAYFNAVPFDGYGLSCCPIDTHDIGRQIGAVDAHRHEVVRVVGRIQTKV